MDAIALLSDQQSISFEQDFTHSDFDGLNLAESKLSIELTYPNDYIPPTQYGLSVIVTNLANQQAYLLKDADAGQLQFESAQFHVPIMVFGSGFSQAITVSNISHGEANVDLIFYPQNISTHILLEDIASVSALSMTDISTEIRRAAVGYGITGLIAFDILVDAPDEAIEVSA